MPPVDAVYHLYCPFVPPEALTTTDDEPQETAPVVSGAVGTVVLICACTAILALSHVPLLAET